MEKSLEAQISNPNLLDANAFNLRVSMLDLIEHTSKQLLSNATEEEYGEAVRRGFEYMLMDQNGNPTNERAVIRYLNPGNEDNGGMPSFIVVHQGEALGNGDSQADVFSFRMYAPKDEFQKASISTSSYIEDISRVRKAKPGGYGGNMTTELKNEILSIIDRLDLNSAKVQETITESLTGSFAKLGSGILKAFRKPK